MATFNLKTIKAKNADSNSELKIKGIGRARELERADRKASKEDEKFFQEQERRKHDLLASSELDQKIESLSRKKNADLITLDPSQQRAVEGMLKNKFGILIGPAGCGKTTTENAFVKLLEQKLPKIKMGDTYFKTMTYTNSLGEEVQERRLASFDSQDQNAQTEIVSVAFASFTGKAVENMKAALPDRYKKSCSTIHSLLGFYPEYFEDDAGNSKRKFIPSFDRTNKLPQKCFVFDEAGMIPPDLWNMFIDACKPDARIYLIGDINQLPPVIGRSTLGFAMTKWPTFELTEIHRQAKDNAIITNAHNILHGKYPMKKENQFFLSLNMEPGENAASKQFLKAIKLLTNAGKFDPMQDAILVPQNVGMLGQLTLNEHLVLFFNPEKEENGIVVNRRIRINTGTTTAIYAVGDKVMVLSNNKEAGLTNGMTGFIKEIVPNTRHDTKVSDVDYGDDIRGSLAEFDPTDMEDHFASLESMAHSDDEEEDEKSISQRQASHRVKIIFGSGEEFEASTAGDFGNLAHAYAFTCHKAQGSEYRNVVVLAHAACSRLLSREWLYTAVTRAQECVYLLGNERGLSKAINKQNIKGKTLADKIENFNKFTNASSKVSSKDTLPILWDPKEIN